MENKQRTNKTRLAKMIAQCSTDTPNRYRDMLNQSLVIRTNIYSKSSNLYQALKRFTKLYNNEQIEIDKRKMIIKNTIRQTTILLITLFISSCSSNNEKAKQPTSELTIESNTEQTSTIQTQESEKTSATLKLSLDNFKGIPEEVDGCACYFSETEMQFKNNEYLFAAGFDSIGFVSVDNKLVKLKLVSTEREPDTFGDYDHIDIYSSELYKVIVDIKYKNSNGDETWWNDGTVTIESKDGQKVIKYFVGECGC